MSGEYLYGRNAVLEALRAGREVRRVLVAEGAHGSGVAELVAEARRRGIPVVPERRERLDLLLGDRHHQGVLAEVAPFAYARMDDLLERAEQSGQPPLLVVLDSLQDPQNFGTLLRTAQACGAHGVVIPEHRAVGVTPAVVKASAGAVQRLAVAREPNLVRALERARAHGVWTFGLDAGARQTFWEVDWRGPTAVVVGAEGAGLGRLVREACDGLVRIPMASGAVSSLNAATAGSLVLYEVFRQRLTAAAS